MTETLALEFERLGKVHVTCDEVAGLIRQSPKPSPADSALAQRFPVTADRGNPSQRLLRNPSGIGG